MNCWKILQIEKTTDKKQIKKAYHEKLKSTKPEDDEKGFMELRSAYEQALEYAEYEEEYDEEAYEEEYEGEADRDKEEELSEEEQAITDWQKRIAEIYQDYEKRIDVTCWKKLLYEDIPAQIRYYELCRHIIYWQILPSCYLPHTVTKLMDDFFSYTGTEVERAKNNNSENSRHLNKRMKLNEIIEFSKMFVAEEAESYDIDQFFALYTELCKDVLRWEDASFVKGILNEIQKVYEQAALTYLPYECLAVALQMAKSGADKDKEAIARLEEKYQDAVEVRLLEAEYALYQGECEKAKTLLKALYQEIPEKSYSFTYQMARCCKAAGMYYEAYQLVKYLTWMRPEKWHFELADEICDLLEAELETKAVATEEDLIALCRVYLRSNREEKGMEILEQVTVKDCWEYNMAYSLCSFCGEEKVCAEPDYYTYLVNYPKERLNVIQRLEWEELQARYWYEQSRYKESMDQCNRLLQEYPISYPILLLRSHVDYSWGQYKQRCSDIFFYGGEKDFKDLDYLLSMNENRIEARMLVACVQRYAQDCECALKALEPIKEKVPMEYEYCRLWLLEEDGYYEEAMDGWWAFWKHVKENPVKVPAVSKYYLMDLREMYGQSAHLLMHNRKEWESRKKEHYEYLKSMADSEYNHPERYADFNFLYQFAHYGDFDEAEQYALKKLETAETTTDRIDVYKALMGLYGKGNKIEKAEQLYEQFSKEYQKIFSNSLSFYLYGGEEYEKVIKWSEVWRKNNALSIHEYVRLGRAYCYKKDADYQKAREVWEEAILRITHSGDYWQTENLYDDIADTYEKEGKWKDCTKYLDLMREHTKVQTRIESYGQKYASAYENILEPYVQEGDIETVEKMCWNVPDNGMVYLSYTLGRAYDNCITSREDAGEDCTELIERAIAYYKKDVEEGFGYYASYGRLAHLYDKAGKREDAKEILEEITEDCIEYQRTGGYWDNCNLFQQLGNLYRKEEKWENALKYFNLWREYGVYGQEVTESEYADCAAEPYFMLGEYHKAYALFKCIYEQENPLALLSLALTAFCMEDYALAKKHFRDVLTMEGIPVLDILLRIAHCEYMENGRKNPEVFADIREEILSPKNQETGTEGECAYILADIALAMGEEAEAAEYVRQAESFSWEDEESRQALGVYYHIWRLFYEGEYEEALQLIESSKVYKGDSEIHGLRTYLQKMTKKN